MPLEIAMLSPRDLLLISISFIPNSASEMFSFSTFVETLEFVAEKTNIHGTEQKRFKFWTGSRLWTRPDPVIRFRPGNPKDKAIISFPFEQCFFHG